MKKRSISLVLNLLIISFELVGFIFSYLYNHRIAIEFYTECSNIINQYQNGYIILNIYLRLVFQLLFLLYYLY